MRVLFLTPYFPPDVGSSQRQMHQLSTRLAAMGHELTVLTAVPHYPAGVVPRPYRRKWLVRERVDGIRVLRTWIYATPRSSAVLRLANHISFMLAATASIRALPREVDVIYTDSPPLFNGLAAFLVGRARRAPYVFNVADLWPQIVFEMGMASRFPLRNMAEALERFIYAKATRITTVTQGFADAIRLRGVEPERLHFIPLGTDVECFRPDIDGSAWRRRLEAEGRFMVMYAGTHGQAQNLATLLAAARLLITAKHIVFRFVGTGLEKARLMQQAAQEGLTNVAFVEPQPLDVMPQVVAAADCHVVPLRVLPVFRMTIPAKIYEILSAGKPLIGSLDGEAARLIRRAGAGVCVEPENPEALADAILRLSEDRDLCREYGAAGREYAVRHHSYGRIAQMLHEVLETAAAEL